MSYLVPCAFTDCLFRTKEVGWEADDEVEDCKPHVGVKKRYRFVLDFSRRSSKSKGENNGNDLGFKDNHDYSIPYRHRCYSCNAPRSNQYHQNFPFRPGKKPRPSLCTQCRYHRRFRITNHAHSGNGHCRVDKLINRIDKREWCGSCGTLRSEKYHNMLLSGELPAWDDICGQCIINKERKMRRERFRGFYERENATCWSEDDRYDSFRDARLQNRQRSSYAFKPIPSREEVKPVISTNSISDTQTRDKTTNSFDNSEPPVVAASPREYASYNPANIDKTSDYRRAKILRTNLESDASEADLKPWQQSRQHSMRPKLNERLMGQAMPQGAPLSVEASTSQQSIRLHDSRERQTNSEDLKKCCTAAARSTAGSSSSPKKEREAWDYFKLPRMEDWYKKHAQSKAKVVPKEPNGKPILADSPAENQELRVCSDYFKLPLSQQKRCETRKWPTSTDSRQHKQSRERYTDRRDHLKCPSTSSTEPVQLQAQKLVHFDLDGNKTQPQKPTSFTDQHPVNGNSQAQPRGQSESRFKKRQKQKQQPIPWPQTMGVSDMYWASENGQAEQAFTAGCGLRFSTRLSAPGSTSTSTASSEAVGHDFPGVLDPRGHSSSAFTSPSPSSLPDSVADHKIKVWEVDSDEADTIEQDHARLATAAVTGKRRAQSGQAEGYGGRAAARKVDC
ncbi:hypothetical protein P885DRAFT_29882 [Corynascus similis CBS 632.67]